MANNKIWYSRYIHVLVYNYPNPMNLGKELNIDLQCIADKLTADNFANS